MRTSKLAKAAGYTALILISIMFIVPFIWLVRSSLMDLSQIFTMPPEWIPKPFHWDNFHKALTVLPFDVFFKNTIIIVFGVLIGTVATSSIAAFGFSRIRWKGRDAVFAILMTSMMLPFAVTMIPTFLGWKEIGFYDTLYPLIVPAYFGGGIFNIFLLRQFYLTIPGISMRRPSWTEHPIFKSIGKSFFRSAARRSLLLLYSASWAHGMTLWGP